MTEQRAPYGPPLIWRTVASYHLHHHGQASEHTGKLEVEARDAIEAGQLALEAVRKMTPKYSVIFNLVLTVTLTVPNRNGANENDEQRKI